MQSHTRLKQQLKHKKSSWQTQWKKIGKRDSGLYQYRPSKMYYARVRSGGKVYWESLTLRLCSNRWDYEPGFHRLAQYVIWESAHVAFPALAVMQR
jgi:hypothetical protein